MNRTSIGINILLILVGVLIGLLYFFTSAPNKVVTDAFKTIELEACTPIIFSIDNSLCPDSRKNAPGLSLIHVYSLLIIGVLHTFYLYFVWFIVPILLRHGYSQSNIKTTRLSIIILEVSFFVSILLDCFYIPGCLSSINPSTGRLLILDEFIDFYNSGGLYLLLINSFQKAVKYLLSQFFVYLFWQILTGLTPYLNKI